MEDYYTKNAKAYEEETRNADRSSVYSFLRPYLPKGKLSVLDVGFGSGRDRLYFKSLGYDVEGIDTSLPFVIDAKKKGLTCYQADRIEFVPSHSYDLIYALASLHHLKREDIYPTIKKFLSYLKKDGVIIIEWADMIKSELPEERLEIKFKIVELFENSKIFTAKK